MGYVTNNSLERRTPLARGSKSLKRTAMKRSQKPMKTKREPPALILLDWMMPNGGGPKAAEVAVVEGKEAVLVVAEIAPGATTGKHLHAGQEFAYLLEGSLRLVADGKLAVTLTPGEAFVIPAAQRWQLRLKSALDRVPEAALTADLQAAG